MTLARSLPSRSARWLPAASRGGPAARVVRRLAGAAARFDPVLVGAALAVSLLGVVMVWSATRTDPGAAGSFVARQLAWTALGAAAMAAAASVDLELLRRWANRAYGLSAAGLLAVLSPLGSSVNGAQAWFDLGPLRLQPAEFAKLALILALAAHGHRAGGRLGPGPFLGALALAAPPCVLVLGQPDLGTAVVLVALTGGVVLMAGAPGRLVALVAVAGILLAAGAVRAGVLEPYQVDRLTGFLHQSADPQGATWNLEQSKIAIGSGGIAGRGLFEGPQTALDYVPEQHTDFVFTVVGEELGLLGSATLLALFALMAGRILWAAWHAATPFGALCCAGVLAMLVFQVFQNIGMTMGVMPITGIPLPLVSYGGSSTIACFLAVGLVVNVARAPRRTERHWGAAPAAR